MLLQDIALQVHVILTWKFFHKISQKLKNSMSAVRDTHEKN